MTIVEMIEKFGVMAYALIIFFGGRYGLKFFNVFEKTKHNFLAFATFFALLFHVGEAMAGIFDWSDFVKYLLTYCAVTSAYEHIVDYLPFLAPKKKVEMKKARQEPYPGDNEFKPE